MAVGRIDNYADGIFETLNGLRDLVFSAHIVNACKARARVPEPLHSGAALDDPQITIQIEDHLLRIVNAFNLSCRRAGDLVPKIDGVEALGGKVATTRAGGAAQKVAAARTGRPG